MKHTSLALTLLLSTSTLHAYASDDIFEVKNHSHKHKEGCGHKTISHGDHLDFAHGNHLHAQHSDHFDDHGPVDSKRKLATATHRISKNHNHRHGEDCGHKMVEHGDHKDFLHDGEYHAAHGKHYDLHGTSSLK